VSQILPKYLISQDFKAVAVGDWRKIAFSPVIESAQRECLFVDPWQLWLAAL
jgi:hypothetical protein